MFAAGLLADDTILLQSGLEAAVSEPSKPVLLRWGTTPPATFLKVRFQALADGSVLAGLQDVTEQYRLDVFACGQGAGIFLTDADSIIRWMSPLSEVTLGLTPDLLLGRHNTSNVHPDDVEAIARDTAEILAHPGVEYAFSYRVGHPEIPDLWFLMRFVSTYLPDEPAVGAIINRSEFVLDAAAEDNRSAQMTMAELIPAGVIMAIGGRITIRNNMAYRMLGSTIEQDDPLAWIGALRFAHQAPVHSAVEGTAEGRRESVVAAVDHPHRPPTWLRIETLPALNTAGKNVGFVATFLDVTTETEAREDLKRSQEQLWVQANHDSLTGLANRMQFRDRLEQALARKRRDGHSVAVLFCDLDLFKRVNDEQGHHAGDAVLIEVAVRLKAATRETDTVCRVGGDEFVVICESFSDVSGVEHLAHRLIETVGQPIQTPDVNATIHLSIGVAIATAECSLDDLLSRADGALYTAKDSGRGCYVVAT